MEYELYATKDTVVGEVMTQINFYRNQAEAKRGWGNAIKYLEKSNPNNIPIKDLQLYKLGTLDTTTGLITPDYKFIASSQEFMEG